jgi:hypothetical protein
VRCPLSLSYPIKHLAWQVCMLFTVSYTTHTLLMHYQYHTLLTHYSCTTHALSCPLIYTIKHSPYTHSHTLSNTHHIRTLIRYQTLTIRTLIYYQTLTIRTLIYYQTLTIYALSYTIKHSPYALSYTIKHSPYALSYTIKHSPYTHSHTLSNLSHSKGFTASYLAYTLSTPHTIYTHLFHRKLPNLYSLHTTYYIHALALPRAI